MSFEELKEACLAGCTPAQREAITHIDGPLLVLAGPGSGKTRVITRRIAHLIASGVRPGDILAITFTNKAAGEMKERIEAMGVPKGALVSTFHSFCARMLRIYGRCIGLTDAFTIYDTSDSLSAVKRAMAELEIDLEQFPMKPAGVAKLISHAKNRLLTPEKIMGDRPPEEAQTVARIYERYQKLLTQANAADFDDLLLLMVKLLQEVPETREKLPHRFRYVLVDEYQDTNRAQYLIARGMAASGNLCVTGDPDQSIYAWRGADISNILEFEKDFPTAKVVRLEQNYRSTKKILAAADRVIANNKSRKEKALWTENPDGEPLRLLRCEDEMEEANAVADEIAAWMRRGEFAPRDVAIFYRVNAQSRVIERSLRAEAIPYRIVAGTEYYQRKEVKDLLAYLRLVENPADNVSAQRVANVPPRRLGDASVTKLLDWGSAQGVSLLVAMTRAGEAGVRGGAVQGIESFLNVIRTLRAMPRTPVAPVVEKLLELTQFERHLADSGDGAEDRMSNARELVNAAAEYQQAEPEGTLQGFLEQTALISDVDGWDAKQGGVTLMTLHAAKGLEFPAVVILGLEEGLLPLQRSEDDGHELEEERRLLFVGITRAKRRVILTCADSRARYGKREYTQPSRFLEELPPDVVTDVPAGSNRRKETRETPLFRPSPFKARPSAPSAPRVVKRSENEEIVYDAEYDEDAMQAALHAPFRAGDRVSHPMYGAGKVMDVSGYGEEMRASVHFNSVGLKRLVLKFAHLKKL